MYTGGEGSGGGDARIDNVISSGRMTSTDVVAAAATTIGSAAGPPSAGSAFGPGTPTSSAGQQRQYFMYNDYHNTLGTSMSMGLYEGQQLPQPPPEEDEEIEEEGDEEVELDEPPPLPPHHHYQQHPEDTC